MCGNVIVDLMLQTLFGKEADSLEQATDVPGTCIL